MTDNSIKTSASFADSTTKGGDYQTSVAINAAPDAVFDALATTIGLSNWWSEATGSATTGGELVVRFGNRHKYIRVDETTRPSSVRWTVRKSEPSPEWKGTTITFDVMPDGDDHARLHLRHQGLTPALECYGDCSAGWAFVLGSLVNYVETGRGKPYSTASDRSDEGNR